MPPSVGGVPPYPRYIQSQAAYVVAAMQVSAIQSSYRVFLAAKVSKIDEMSKQSYVYNR